MAQTSLLLRMGIPEAPDDRLKWSERIRKQIVSIAKTVMELEKQKQLLLGRLHEAGDLSATVYDDTQVQESQLSGGNVGGSTGVHCMRNSIASGAYQPVVDLVSEEESSLLPENVSCPPTPKLDGDCSIDDDFAEVAMLEALEPELDNDAHDFSCDSIPKENSDGFLDQEEIDPNLPPSNCPRAYRPEAFHLIDWSQLTIGELKQWVSFFGMKSSLGGKARMISELVKIFKYLRNEIVVPGELPPLTTSVDGGRGLKNSSSSLSKEQLFDSIEAAIKRNESLFERILVFETIEFGELFEYLKPDTEGVISATQLKSVLKEFLDMNHVSFATTADNFEKNRKRKIMPKKVLRKSVSCPD